ncbi:hypothetical protein OB920_02685 [Halobacteria archaeon HArc-gm2]|nr:hypothetical protein [Halobacteria archaeon HArc-gm2]
MALGFLAGCSSGQQQSPPRQSKVFGELTVSGEAIEIPLVADPTVESRADISPNQAQISASQADTSPSVGLDDVAPVGNARAGGRGGRGGRGAGAQGRGAGGYSSAPKGRHGRAIYHGHPDDDDDEWRADHVDDLDRYQATHRTAAIAFLGPTASYSEDPPGPGPVEWDETWENPDPKTLTYSNLQRGWYRAGSHLTAENASHDFGWEVVDFEVTGSEGNYRIENPWKVSPRL